MKDKSKPGYVYRIILDIPDPHVVYVGSTTQTPSGRLGHHATIQRKPTKLNKLIRSIGKEHFSIEVIEYVSDYAERLKREAYWTTQYKDASDNCNDCIGAAKSESMKRRARAENYRNRVVVCDNDNNTFVSCSDAARHYNLCASDVSECCARHLRQVKGYRFRYADEDRSTYVDYWASAGIHRNMRVKCVETGVIYDNCASAARLIGVDHETIKRCCINNKMLRKLKLHFVFAE